MKIAICAIALDENQYFEEWLNHYRKLGIDKFFIYDNLSKIPLSETLKNEKDCKVILWQDQKFKSQSRAYEHCCKNNTDFDYIGFLDMDEFYISKTFDIKKDFENLRKEYGEFDGLGLYWRIYGKPQPYILERQPVEKYTFYSENNHIKSFLNPKVVESFPDPHKAKIKTQKYIDEIGRKINAPIGMHTSKYIYIKHVFTRSLSEYQDKLQRGDANLRKSTRNLQDFYSYNNSCTLKD